MNKRQQTSHFFPIVPLIAALGVLCACQLSTNQRAASTKERAAGEQAPYTYVSYFGGTPNKVYYQNVHGWALVEKDVILGRVSEMEAVREAMEKKKGILQPLGFGLAETSKRWPNKTIPYAFASGLSEEKKNRVKAAMAHWMSKTEIKFVVVAVQTDFVTIQDAPPGVFCNAALGRQGGEQFMNVGDTCQIGNIIHELGHTVGLVHEHKRPDRGNYVTVIDANLKNDPVCQSNYAKMNAGGITLGAYDHGSIMHYPNKDMNCALDPSKNVIDSTQPIGQRLGLSAGDIAAVKTMYP